jgi:uncharacterized repeat protein (TIGR03803 family)
VIRPAFLFSLLFFSAISVIGWCQTETTLYTFSSGTDIMEPDYGLVFDSQGNLYGSSYAGGTNDRGGVFQLSPNGSGWTETVLHSFTGGHSDGTMPNATPVVDASGNVYATTFYGGNTGACLDGCGTIVKLAQTSPGVWTETPVHVFQGHSQGTDGAHPLAIGLNSQGYPYGVTFTGGSSDAGTFYQIVPTAGSFSEKQLFDFANGDVSAPQGGLVMDPQGNLYGTSLGGGANSLGAVFELSPGANGTWTEKAIFSFATDGAKGGTPYPNPDLSMDSLGNLYGTCRQGGLQNMRCGSVGCGFVFKLTKDANGTWQGAAIYKFRANEDGLGPRDGVVLDPAGNVYGTTLYGGGRGGTDCSAGTNLLSCGTVYELTPQTEGTYKETILHRFASSPDGAEPFGGLILDSAGNLYGTTSRGGDATCGFGYGCGIVFEITLEQHSGVHR